jgi:CRISPR-associated protein, Cmr1 family
MQQSLELTLTTLTPLWTGGVDGTTDRLHESGLIGSLRWWHEAIVRGLGGEACDPSRGECTFNAEKYQQSSASVLSQRLRDAGLCDACQLFGATGWRRRFRLTVVDDQTQPIWAGLQPLNIRPPDRARGWFLPPGRMGTFTVRMTGDPEAVQRIAALLIFLEQWGSLGAKPQLGYGAFRIDNREDVLAVAKQANWNTISVSQSASADPDLRQFLFFRFDFTPRQPGWWTNIPGISRVSIQVQPLVQHYNIVPVTPALKNAWRFGQKWNRADEQTIFGAALPNRQRGRIVATWAYLDPGNNRWCVHGWAWLPAQSQTASMLTQTLGNATTWNQTLNVQGTLTQQRPRTTQDVRQLL